MSLYYAPLFQDPSGSIMPGSADRGTLGYCELPIGMKALEYDTGLDRVVVEAPADWTPHSDWSEVDAALVEIDYPGLLGA